MSVGRSGWNDLGGSCRMLTQRKKLMMQARSDEDGACKF